MKELAERVEGDHAVIKLGRQWAVVKILDDEKGVFKVLGLTDGSREAVGQLLRIVPPRVFSDDSLRALVAAAVVKHRGDWEAKSGAWLDLLVEHLHATGYHDTADYLERA